MHNFNAVDIPARKLVEHHDILWIVVFYRKEICHLSVGLFPNSGKIDLLSLITILIFSKQYDIIIKKPDKSVRLIVI